MKITRALFAACVLAHCSLFAATAQWVIDTSSTAAEKTFDGAGDWFVDANWVNEVVASGAGNTAQFYPTGDWNWSSGLRYVTLDRDLTIGTIARTFPHTESLSSWDANKRVILGGDNVITLDGDGGVARLYGLNIYAETRFAASSSCPELYLVDFCGPVVNETGKTLEVGRRNNDGMSRFRRDLWADGTSEGITNVAPSVIRFDERAFLGIVAPEGSDGVSGDWNLVEGSPYATFAGETRHAVSAGAVVTGDGLPEGAYVKRIYPDGRIELSQAATATATATLAFGAFRPKMYQRMTGLEYEYHSSSAFAVGVWPMKYSEADEMTVELDNLTNPASRYSYYVDCEDGFLPGRLVLRNTSAFNYTLYLGTCEVEFAEPTNGKAPGFKGVVQMLAGASGAADIATIVVGDGLTATIGTLTNVTGRVVKKGAGTLVANVPNAEQFAPGTNDCIEVAAGTLALAVSDGAERLSVQTVRVASGATLVLPENGLSCVSFEAEAGATVRGGGELYAETGSAAGVAFEGGIRFIKATEMKDGDYFWDASAAAVPGNPAVWLDVSNGDSLLARDVSVGTRYKAEKELVRWADVRGLEYGWATNGAWRAPQLATNTQGVVDHVHFVYTGSGSSANRYDLTFNAAKTGVRHVFKVVSLLNGRPQPIGGSVLKAEPSRTVFDSAALSIPSGSEWLSNTVFRVNGARGDWRKGYPYRGGIVGNSDADTANVTPFEKLVKTVVEFAVPAPGVSATRIADNGSGGGRERLYECIVYTNALTQSESAQVTRYLMEKWIDAEVNWDRGGEEEIAEIAAEGTTSAYQAAGDVVAVGSLTGTGTLLKEGPGTLFVADAGGGAVSLRVAAGTANVRSFVPTLANSRGNPYLHLDASDADSFTSMSGDYVLGWRDARGEGYVTATALGTRSTARPKRVADALNGMNAVDFYTCYQKKNSNLEYSPGLGFPVVSNAHCVVGLWNTAGGGGPIIGWKDTGEENFPISGDSIGFAMGIHRDSFRSATSNPSYPIVASSDLYRPEQYGSAIARGGKTGGTRTRMNGVDVAAESAKFTGGWDLFSFVCHDNIGASAIQQMAYSATYIIYGGAKIAETFLYTNVPSKEAICRLEAYLRQKWLNEETPRYRPARFDALEVEAGAALSVWGGSPVSANSLRVDGTLAGDVCVADGGEIVVTVAADGTVAPLGVTGSVELAGGGTVRLVGDGVAKLKKGATALFALNGTPGGEWTVAADGARSEIRISAADGSLAMTVIPKGTLLTVW